jgi:tetratricopeptide (TPR) repeat protein
MIFRRFCRVRRIRGTICPWVPAVFGILLAIALTACLQPEPKEGSPEGQGSAAAEGALKESPRVAASLQLTEQGRRLLEDRQPDRAIRILEQAVSLNPLNGQNYYYLAEAWLMKGSAAQAEEFNQLAEIHLKEDPQWMMRVAQQADRIARLDN